MREIRITVGNDGDTFPPPYSHTVERSTFDGDRLVESTVLGRFPSHDHAVLFADLFRVYVNGQ